jgi:hypothetical protein
VEAARSQRSAVSIQLQHYLYILGKILNREDHKDLLRICFFAVFAVQIYSFQRNPNLFTKQNFFAKSKEVTDIEFIRISIRAHKEKCGKLDRSSHQFSTAAIADPWLALQGLKVIYDLNRTK